MNVPHETKYMTFQRHLHELGIRINGVALRAADADYHIMLCRVMASKRGAHPVDVQKAVHALRGE